MRQFSIISSGLALLCAIHCALLPVALTFMPLVGGTFLENHWLEWGMIGLSVLLGGIPLLRGAQQYAQRLPIALFLAGFGLILAEHQGLAYLQAHLLTATGAVFLLMAQLYHIHLQHTPKSCSCEDAHAEAPH